MISQHCTEGIGALLESNGLLHQLYADDVQAYTHCTSDQAVAAVAQMCLAMDVLGYGCPLCLAGL